MSENKKKIIVLASGNGTNAENIFNFFQQDNQVDVIGLYSNKKDAYALKRADKYTIPTRVIDRNYLKNDFVSDLKSLEVDLIVLAGFLLKIPESIVSNFSNKIINIHPSLLPKYGGKGMYGMHVHEAVIKAKEKESGITIHYVNEEYDEGQPLFQAKCNVEEGDDAEALASKIHALEQKYFSSVLDSVLKNKEIPIAK